MGGFSRVQIRKRFNGVEPAEITFIDGVTAGTATASKALVLDSSKGISTITSATITTLTSTTANVSGTLTCGTLATTGINMTQTARTSAAVTKNASTTYADVTGLTATVVAGTYKFRAVLPSTVAGATEGIKYCFNYTTAVLSAIESTAKGFTASAVAVQHTTTTTTQTDLFTQAAAVILVEIEGTMVVTTGGTVAVQMAQNTSGATDTVALLGGSLEFTRIA